MGPAVLTILVIAILVVLGFVLPIKLPLGHLLPGAAAPRRGA
jgi:hypothetical protein